MQIFYHCRRTHRRKGKENLKKNHSGISHRGRRDGSNNKKIVIFETTEEGKKIENWMDWMQNTKIDTSSNEHRHATDEEHKKKRNYWNSSGGRPQKIIIIFGTYFVFLARKRKEIVQRTKLCKWMNKMISERVQFWEERKNSIFAVREVKRLYRNIVIQYSRINFDWRTEKKNKNNFPSLSFLLNFLTGMLHMLTILLIHFFFIFHFSF